MKGKLSSYIAGAFIINVFAILSVGGICTMMVKDMVQNISRLEAESGNVSIIYRLNNKIQHAIFVVHNSIVDFDETVEKEIKGTIDKAESDLLSYMEDEKSRLTPETNEEVILLDKLHDNIKGIQQLLPVIYSNLILAGTKDDNSFKMLEKYAFHVRNLTQSINDVHFRIVSGLVKESYSKMYFILLLYLVCSLVGILASCVGYVVLSRHTIKPIMNLATATRRITSGDLAIRVETDSETEIGTLYQSFNAMTERLQEHERKREDFNRMLEKLVKERTRELLESEESLRRTQSELVRMEKIATLGQIATSVNHEIKTPLNVLYMNLQLLIRKINQCSMEGDSLKQSMLGLTEIINNEIGRINEIVEEFVKYARFPAPNIKESDINKILSNIAEMITQNARDGDIDITLHLDENLRTCPADDKMMIQALLNLCMNAIQAMPYGGSLRIESKKMESCAKISIIDTGQGIEPADIDHIFDPFFTKKDGGLGFGLAIVQRIIEDHRGSISCRSEVDKGTEFTIILPTTTKTICRDII
ncbi:MAG: ATP-binding protein [Pseudomonadota bacterium]